MNLYKMSKAKSTISEIFKELDDMQMILSVIGTSFDEWCARKGMTSEETCDALKVLVSVQEQVHSMMGTADYINE